MAVIQTANTEANTGSFLWFYFSPNGRVSRWDFWLRGVFLGTLAIGLLLAVIYVLDASTGGDGEISSLAELCLVVWPGIAVNVKRWHDRDKSGWWCLIGLIPIVGWIYAFVELGCLAGTPGENRFGADPLSSRR